MLILGIVLSRSSCSYLKNASGDQYEIVRSETICSLLEIDFAFNTRAEQIQYDSAHWAQSDSTCVKMRMQSRFCAFLCKYLDSDRNDVSILHLHHLTRKCDPFPNSDVVESRKQLLEKSRSNANDG